MADSKLKLSAWTSAQDFSHPDLTKSTQFLQLPQIKCLVAFNNFGKCKCLHTGHGNLDVHYKMGDTVLGTTVKEKDLGVTISAEMKVSEQCGIAASKGNQILGLIRRNKIQGNKS